MLLKNNAINNIILLVIQKNVKNCRDAYLRLGRDLDCVEKLVHCFSPVSSRFDS